MGWVSTWMVDKCIVLYSHLYSHLLQLTHGSPLSFQIMYTNVLLKHYEIWEVAPPTIPILRLREKMSFFPHYSKTKALVSFKFSKSMCVYDVQFY